MIWVVDGYEVDVLVSSKTTVEVVRWDEYKKIIQVPAILSTTEVKWTIHNLLEKSINCTTREFEYRIEIFDRSWPIKLLAEKKRSYLENGIVHFYSRQLHISSTVKERIVAELLQQIVSQHIGEWEERMGILVNQIKFRKNNNRPYKVQRALSFISFDSGLHHLSLEAIAYCSFNAVAQYGNLDSERKWKFIRLHFPSWKLLDKIIKYAYQT